MIVEIVTFRHPPGQSREEILDQARATVPHWQANVDLIRKHYLLGDGNAGGAVYLWRSREAAEAAHGDAWRARVRAMTGQDPEVVRYEAMMVLDNDAGAVTEWP